MSNDNNHELERFVNNPNYRLRVLKKLQSREDKEYRNNVVSAEKLVNKLIKDREKEIKRVSESRWKPITKKVVKANYVEGLVRVDDIVVKFSDIQGAELNIICGCRTNNVNTGKSKKHASIGGAVAGGALFGPVGAVVGGVGLGKTKHTGNTISNEIPTCLRLGVFVKLAGQVKEVVFIQSRVDQDSNEFSNAYTAALNLISKFDELAKTPIPENILAPEEEESILAIDSSIAAAKHQLEERKAKVPTHQIPEIYRLLEYSELSDEDYLSMLEEQDRIRGVESKATRNSLSLADISSSKAINIIYNVFFWLATVFMLLFSIGLFGAGYTLSGVVAVLVAIGSNPLFNKIINRRGIRFPRWGTLLAFIVGFSVVISISIFTNTDSDYSSSSDNNSVSEATSISEETEKNSASKSSSNNRIVLSDGEKGEYGKPVESGGEKYYHYYVPNGDYKAVCKIPCTVFVVGEDPNDVKSSKALSENDTASISVPNGYHIELSMNGKIVLSKK